MDYTIVKSLHIICVIVWMAGLFYLPRLFVYHSSVNTESETSEIFKVMERKLFKIIMNPALVMTWVFGVWLVILIPDYFYDRWFHIKIVTVSLLTIFHHVLGRWMRAFIENRNKRSSLFFRVSNELPTIGLIIIVFMVVMKPL